MPLAYLLHATSSGSGLVPVAVTLSVAALVMGLAAVIVRLQR
jgi:uncharacterized membrane protein